MTRWFEDIPEGEVFPLGEHTFTREEIIRFATLYDPQYFHIDPEKASLSQFGGIVASGWHTGTIGHRKMVDALTAEEARLRAAGEQPGLAGPSPGIDRMDFKNPVRPGETVIYTLTLTSKRPSNSKPGWGILHQTIEGHKSTGEPVYEASIVGFCKLRDYTPTLRERLAMWAITIPWLRPLLRR